ncbi:MAG: hypothetical protein EXR46_10935 [Dehalococcoidia bacterium]|nr:hypothetical protein [Dehalococcoidia bacterium]
MTLKQPILRSACTWWSNISLEVVVTVLWAVPRKGAGGGLLLQSRAASYPGSLLNLPHPELVMSLYLFRSTTTSLLVTPTAFQ